MRVVLLFALVGCTESEWSEDVPWLPADVVPVAAGDFELAAPQAAIRTLRTYVDASLPLTASPTATVMFGWSRVGEGAGQCPPNILPGACLDILPRANLLGTASASGHAATLPIRPSGVSNYDDAWIQAAYIEGGQAYLSSVVQIRVDDVGVIPTSYFNVGAVTSDGYNLVMIPFGGGDSAIREYTLDGVPTGNAHTFTAGSEDSIFFHEGHYWYGEADWPSTDLLLVELDGSLNPTGATITLPGVATNGEAETIFRVGDFLWRFENTGVATATIATQYDLTGAATGSTANLTSLLSAQGYTFAFARDAHVDAAAGEIYVLGGSSSSIGGQPRRVYVFDTSWNFVRSFETEPAGSSFVAGITMVDHMLYVADQNGSDWYPYDVNGVPQF